MWARTAESSHMIVQSTRDSFWGKSGVSNWFLYSKRSRRDAWIPGGGRQRRRGRGTGGCSNEGSSVGTGPFRCCCLGQHHLKQLGSIRNRPEIFGQNYEQRFNTLSLMEANFIRFVMRGATKRNEYFCSHLSLHTVILYIKRAFRRFLAHEDRCQNIVKQAKQKQPDVGTHTHQHILQKFYIHLSFC